MDINTAISALLNYAESEKLISGLDRAYCANRLLELLKLDTFTDNKTASIPLCDTLSLICSYAYEKGIIESLATDYTDLFDTKVMGLLCPRPSEVISTFENLYEENPELANEVETQIVAAMTASEEAKTAKKEAAPAPVAEEAAPKRKKVNIDIAVDD